MPTTGNIVWVRQVENPKLGHILMRLCHDYDRNQHVRISSMHGGVEISTFGARINTDAFCEGNDNQINGMVDAHIKQISAFNSVKEHDGESPKDWFKIIEVHSDKGAYNVLLEHSAVDEMLTATVYDQSDKMFWSTEYQASCLYDIGLEEYAEDIGRLLSEANESIVLKLLTISMTEEDPMI